MCANACPSAPSLHAPSPRTADGANCIERIAPASAGRETSLLLLVALLVMLLSGAVIFWRSQQFQGFSLQAHQLDLATALTPAEQGIYADLQAVADEWQQISQSTASSTPPSAKQWADDAWPPFATGLNASQRGAHSWALVQHGADFAYLGRSAKPELASDMLWRLPQGSSSRFDIWLLRSTAAAPATQPQLLDDASLIRQGWRQVIATEQAAKASTR